MYTKESINLFEPSNQWVDFFTKQYNGKGVDNLILKLMKATHDKESASYALSCTVESALIDIFSQISNENYRVLPQYKEYLLEESIMKRIPRLSIKDKSVLAKALIKDLKNCLNLKTIDIDEGLVTLVNDNIVVTVSPQ